ncbi:MAG TPA: iron uptake transporter deferrochelatase/peroxidase subunit [Solirubrobacter sp.]
MTPAPGPRVSRRRLLQVAAAGAVAGGGVAGAIAFNGDDPAPAAATTTVVPFHGRHQAGIATAVQDRQHFASFDLLEGTTRADLTDLLKTWTQAAAAMTAGTEIGGSTGSSDQLGPPQDTGEALGLHASRLTITAGFGPTLFTLDGKDRFGVAARRPAALEPLPKFADDALDPARSDGDLCIQACADDPQVAVHAVRNLARLAHGIAAVRFSQLGFGRTSSTTRSQATPRNLFGFKDGTANLKAEDGAAMRQHVWVAPGDDAKAAWMVDGSYLVARRVRMTIETWDRDSLGDQEQVIGRQKRSGAPFSSMDEFARLDLAAKGPDGGPLVPARSHVRLAHPESNGGAQLLRRGYSFVDGSDPLGRLEAGLYFLAYQRDPRTQFARIQQRLAGKHNDAMNEYITHVASGLYAIPPGVSSRGDWWGRALFA